MSTEGERPEAKQWQCVSADHWRSTSQRARAFRSPRAAGVHWNEVVRRTTRVLPKRTVIDDIYIQRDGIEEAAACLHIGGSRDVQTDVYTTAVAEIVVDDQHRSQNARGRTQAASPESRHTSINKYRNQKISEANRQFIREVSSDP